MLDRVLVRWPLKLLALGLAYVIWLALTSEPRVIEGFDVPLDYSVAEDVVLSGSPSPPFASVTLRGPASLVRSIDQFQLSFKVRLDDAQLGQPVVPLSSALLEGVPRGVEVRTIEPDRVTFQVDRKLRRTLQVVPFFLGEPREGYQLYDYQVLPASLEIEGPEGVVRGLTRLRTEPIRLDDETGPFNVRIGLMPESADVRPVDRTLRPEVRVDIDEAPEEAVFDEVPVVLAGESVEVRVDPDSVRVILSAPPSVLAGIDAAQVRALADVTGLEPRKKPYAADLDVEVLDLPPRERGRVTIKSVSPREVSVRVVEPEGSG